MRPSSRAFASSWKASVIKEMKKVQIIGPRADIDECIRLLHSLAVVHIETIPESESDQGIFKTLPLEKEKLREKEMLDRAHDRLSTLRALLDEPRNVVADTVSADDVPGLITATEAVVEEARAIHHEKDDLAEESAMLEKYERLLRGFAPIVSRLGGLRNFEIVGLTIEKTREDIAGLLSKEVARVTEGNYQIHVKDLGDDTIGIVLTYPRKYIREVRFLLTGRSINELKLPELYEEMTLFEALKNMNRRRDELPDLMLSKDSDLRRLSELWYGTVAGLIRAVDDMRDEIGALAYAGQTRFSFVIEGWVPLDMFGRVSEEFVSVFNGRVMVRELDITGAEIDHVPVCIRNSAIFRPFEIFLAALPPPKYGSIDPTPYIALFFPVFFGLIVGDIGYGAIIGTGAFLLSRRFRDNDFFRNVFIVMTVCGVSALIFGVLFGELFGDFGERMHWMHPIIFNRIEALKTLMVITIGIGAGHIILGLTIGAANRLVGGHRKEAAIKITTLALIAIFFVIMGVMFEYLPKSYMTPAVFALIGGLVVLIVLEGVIGPLEFIKTLGNMLSYVRIMAVGTASVVMALVANQMSGISDNLIVGILVAVVIHAFNILLSIVSPVIQSMRLQYVEFFSKFYEAGGRRYAPFRKR
jgi:V/A-type H+-transporting ATPase subunit I